MCVGGILMSTIAASGRVERDLAQQRLGVLRLADEVEARSASSRASPARISAMSSAITIRIRASDPRPSRSSASVRRARRRPPRRGRPRARARAARAAAGTPGSRASAPSLASVISIATDDRPAVAAPLGRADAVEHHAVGGRLDRRRQALRDAQVESQRHPLVSASSRRDATSRRRSATPDGSRARASRSSSSAARISSRASVAVGPFGSAERDGERDQPLLRAVVQVALEPPPLGVADLDDPRARRGQLGEL